MNVVVTLEQRFHRTPDGHVWTSSKYEHAFWRRYLEVFDSVRVVGRVRATERAPATLKRVDGAKVSVTAVPYYVGPGQYVLRRAAVRDTVRRAVSREDAVIMRVGSPIAADLKPALGRVGHPYALEVVGDPHDVFAPGAVRHPLRAFFRWWFSKQLRRQCAEAAATSYVTAVALQRRYPPREGSFTIDYSSVEMPAESFVDAPRPVRAAGGSFDLVTVGALEQLYKAQDVLIEAVAACVAAKLDLRLVLVGGGRHLDELRGLAERLGIARRVAFRGQLPAGAPVREEMDRGDLFVLASRQEGLPRAMIEAMGRALPCIGSTVGGIPELLDAADLVPPGDATELARKIREVLTDPRRMARMSAQNLQRSRDFSEQVLAPRRRAMYGYLKERTQVWLARTIHEGSS